MDPFFLQDLGRLDAFPRGGDLDQNPVVADAGIVIETHQLAPLGNRAFGVVAEAGIHFCGHATWHQLKNLLAEDHADFIKRFVHHVFHRCLRAQQAAG